MILGREQTRLAEVAEAASAAAVRASAVLQVGARLRLKLIAPLLHLRRSQQAVQWRHSTSSVSYASCSEGHELALLGLICLAVRCC